MKNMKIGILLMSDNYAGAENAIYNLSKSFIKQNQETILFTNEEMIKYYQPIKKLKLINLGKFFSLGIIKRLTRINKIRKLLLERLTSENFSTLLLFLEYSYLIVNSFYNKTKVPIIATLRGSEIQEYYHPKGIKGVIIRRLMENSFKKSYKIFSQTQEQLNLIPEKYKKKTIVIPNGVDSRIFKPFKKRTQKKNVVLFTGRYIERKGIIELLNVAKQLPEYEFWFAGQGPLANIIKGNNIKNLGFKDTKELVKLYNQATIAILPSWWEGFSNTGLEASSCGIAIIATKEGFGDYLENGKDSLLIPSKDERALKEAITKLMTDKKLRKTISKNARKKALNYSWDKVANQYFKVFKQMDKK
jgi:glycosyltransferase involved in cell wall biosynthesis